MTTVVGPQSSVATLCELRFMAIAVDLIQPYRPLATSKSGPTWCSQHPPTAQLSTHHLGIDQVPFIITYCGPQAIEEDLHPARTGVVGETVNQSHWRGSYEKMIEEVMA